MRPRPLLPISGIAAAVTVVSHRPGGTGARADMALAGGGNE